MSNKGYGLEHEIEAAFLQLEGKTCEDPIFDTSGKITRTFRVPTSGMMASLPGDVVTGNPKFTRQFMVECKARRHSSKKEGIIFRLNMGWVEKNEKEAVIAGYLPVFVLSFKGTQKNRLWVVINSTVLEYFYGKFPPAVAVPIAWKKKKTVILVKNYLDKHCYIHAIGNLFLLPWSDFFTRIKYAVNHENN